MTQSLDDPEASAPDTTTFTPYEHGGRWPKDRAAAAIEWWKSGLSASDIADRFGDGVPRNAVIGFLHRKGLLTRTKDGEARPKRPSKPKKTTLERIAEAHRKMLSAKKKKEIEEKRRKREERKVEVTITAQGDGVLFEDLEKSSCRYIIDSTHPQRYCGDLCCSGSSYCANHHKIIHAPPRRR